MPNDSNPKAADSLLLALSPAVVRDSARAFTSANIGKIGPERPNTGDRPLAVCVGYAFPLVPSAVEGRLATRLDFARLKRLYLRPWALPSAHIG